MLFQDFKRALKKINCNSNDIILVHADISKFEGKNWNKKCEKLKNFLINFFNKDSTLIFPAFTYSFCDTGIFKPKRSPSEVGIFDEYMRNQKSFERTDHPIFSFACKGKHKNLFLNNSNSSTGSGSVFEKLYAFDAKILFLGCRFITSCTFLHFVEQKNTILYRYSKNFFPKNKMKYAHYEYYVRSREKYKFYGYKKKTTIEKDLIREKILKKISINKFEISCCSARDVFCYVSKKIKKDPFYILSRKPDTI